MAGSSPAMTTKIMLRVLLRRPNQLLGALDHRLVEGQHPVDQRLHLLAIHRIDLDVELLRIGDESRILHGLVESLAQGRFCTTMVGLPGMWADMCLASSRAVAS